MRATCVCMEQFESRTLLSAGAVDSSYAGAYDNSALPQLYGEQVHAQLDGKMIHYSFNAATSSTQLWRTNPNGSLDTTFGAGGAINLGDFKVTRFAAQPDGKLVVLLRQDANNSISIRRYNPSGTPDTSFAVGGNLTLNISPYQFYSQLAVQTDGKILIGGNDDYNAYLRRYNTNGSLDTSFATGGILTVAPTTPMGLGWVWMGGLDIRRSDSRIVFATTDVRYDGRDEWDLRILAPNGAQEWWATDPMPDEGASPGNLVVDGDGSILVSGTSQTTDNAGDYVSQNVLVRYPAPKSTSPITWVYRPDADSGEIFPQVDGKLLTILGKQVQRLNYNLTNDTSFANGGSIYLSWQPTGIALQGDGKIVIDGEDLLSPKEDGTYHSMRFTGDSPAATLAADGTLTLSGSARNDFIRASTTGGIVGIQNNATGPFSFTASTVKKIVANTGDGNDTVLLSGALPNSILNGGNGNDTLTGADGADTLNGGLGNDILKGGNNRDTVTYAGRSSGLVLSIDNSANDGQTGEFDNISMDIETVIGGNANDRITGSDATNALYGGPGNDLLIGKAGNDLLGGQDGNDTMDGGLGSDGFFGNAGIDTADYSNRWDALIITQDEIANDGKAGEYDNVHRDVEVIKSGNLGDKITAWDINNTLYGLGGNDTLIGGGGNDAIYGGAGNDQLTGSSGADSLFGDDGDDTLFARDGVADLLLNGGNGFDSAQIDSSDTNRTSIEKYLP